MTKASKPIVSPPLAPVASDAPPVATRGVALGLFASDPQWNYGDLLQELHTLGANAVLLTPVWAQANRHATDIRPSRISHTVSIDDDALRRTIRQARALGLTVTLHPIVRLEQKGPTEWRGRIEPRLPGERATTNDAVDRWFKSYQRYLVNMATIASDEGVERLSVGSEFLSLERYEGRWRTLIAEVRKHFKGRLVYAGNWDQLEVSFLDAVDEVAVSAYFELAKSDAPVDDSDLRAAWRVPRDTLKAFAARHGKPLLLIEVGYPSRQTAAFHPWDETAASPVDVALQARLWQTFCDVWGDDDDVGFFAWNWFGAGGVEDGGYTLRGKPAAAALARCLRR